MLAEDNAALKEELANLKAHILELEKALTLVKE